MREFLTSNVFIRRLVANWTLIVVALATVLLGSAVINLNSALRERSDAVIDREKAFRVVRPFNRLQREELRLLVIAEAGGENFDPDQYQLQRDLVESRFFDVNTVPNRSDMDQDLLDVLNQALAKWQTMQPRLDEWAANPEVQALQRNLIRELADLELLINQADNIHNERTGRADTNLITSEEQLSVAIIFGVVAILVFMASVILTVFGFRRQLEVSRQAREQAEISNQLKSQFLAKMSHELRTPLNAIINFNDFVLQEVYGPVNEDQRGSLSKAHKSAYDLLNLINDILDFSKIESGMMELFIEDVDLNEVVEEVLDTSRGLMQDKTNIQLITEVDPDLPSVKGDKMRLEQILLNLTSNAIKFTEHGTVTLKAQKQGDGVLFCVKDTGIGIPLEDQPNIFEEFRQSRQNKQTIRDNLRGTGLGLTIAKHFTEAHGGRLWMESQPNVGSTFYFTLPLQTPQAK